jgi:hypothetical protein
MKTAERIGSRARATPWPPCGGFILVLRNPPREAAFSSAGAAQEAVMDALKFPLLHTVDEWLRRAELILEQQQLHILHLHPTRRASAERELRRLFNEYLRLRATHQAALAETAGADVN